VIFESTPISGAFVIRPEFTADDRGAFARTFCTEEFAAMGLDPRVVQCSVSINTRAGTLRGLHYQADPHGEAKLVRCSRGAIFDVAVDLRTDSPTYLRWFGVTLDDTNHSGFFIPRGCAHGFQTLVDASEIAYQISTQYSPEAGRGVRWDDPAFAIEWPEPPSGGRMLSERDARYADYHL
jgi:dTDP-4-dehydrorhamnose 3,5-epimerase